MHPAKQVEMLLLKSPTSQEDRDKAMIFAMLAVADALENLGHDIRESGKDISLELGSISVVLGRD